MNMFTNLRTPITRTLTLATIFAMLLSAFPASIFVAEAANPSVIFADSFVSQDFSAWTYVDDNPDKEWKVVGGGSKEGTYKARARGAQEGIENSVLRRDISTEGYENISLSFYHKDGGFEEDDSVVVEYSHDGGSTWTEIETFDESNEVDDISQQGWVFFTDDLPANAADNADFQFRFRATLDAANDKFDLDAVVIAGDEIEEPVDYCDPSQRPGGMSVAEWHEANDFDGSSCFDYEVVQQCGSLDVQITTNETPFNYAFYYSVGDEMPAEWDGDGALPVNFAEDENGGSVEVTYYVTGPESDYFVGSDVPNWWDGNGETVLVSTDCEQGEPEPVACEYGFGEENLLTNGSFEEPEVTDHAGTWELFQSIPGWVAETVSGATASMIELQSGIFGGASDGEQHAELDVDEPVKMTQSVTTIPGATYELRFDFKAREGSGAENNAVEATADGAVVASASTQSTEWDTYSGTFVAGDSSTDISLADITGVGGTDGTGTLVDNAVLCQVAEPVSVAEVTMCKYDEEETPLPNWTLNLLGDHVETVEVPSDGTEVFSTANLDGDYVFVANGTYIYRPSAVGSTSDAAFTMRSYNGDPIDPTGHPYEPWVLANDLPTPYEGYLAITVDGELGTTDWGDVFNPSHEYAMAYTGEGDTVGFKIVDDGYGDNSGSLTVDIYEGFSGVTEQNGCVTFAEVPYGDYIADEIMQDGWRNLSGLGEVTIEDDVTIEVVNTDEPEPVDYCSVTVVSDETNYVEETEANAVLTWVHNAWTAVVDSADWIWGSEYVQTPAQEEIQTFTKSFEWSGPIASATLDIASDNYYTVYLNGVEVAAEQSDADNFRVTTQDQYDVSGDVVEGVNELEIVVTNAAGVDNPERNPAGLLYNLTIVSTEEGEECMYAPEEPVEPSLVITNPATDYEVLAGTHTFMAEYVDADDDDDGVQWAIRAGTCSAATNTVAGNVDGFSTDFDWDGADFSSTIDMSTWDDGDYCLIVNPVEDQAPNFRETRWFTLENPVILTCEPGVNLVTNGSFEEPVVEHEAGWNIFEDGQVAGWAVDWFGDFDGAPDNGWLELQAGVNDWFPALGNQYAELDGDWQGPGGTSGEEASVKIAQTIPTIADKTYTLSWDFSPRPGTDRSDNQLGVSIGGEELVNSPYMADGSGLENTDWNNFSHQFTGTGGDVEIAFWDDGSSNAAGTFLDNVSLTCDPSTGQADAYCGDGEVNQDWEQCEPGEENCADYCLYDNQCHADVELMKITLNSTQSASFDDQAYIGASDRIAPNGYWFNMDDFGPDSAVSFVGDVEGLALSYDGSELKLAFEGNNDSGVIDYVQGSLEFVGFTDLDLGAYSDNVSREINGSTYKLEPLSGTGGFPDQFEVMDVASVDFDMRADVGNDGVTLSLTAAEEFGQCEVEEDNGDGEEIVEEDNGDEEDGGGGGGGATSYAGEGYASRHGGSSPTGQVLGESVSADMCVEYLHDNILLGQDNDYFEVLKLQNFLRLFEGHTGVPLSGVYGPATQAAVGEFQTKYAENILAPWGINWPTLNVYLTTRKTVNEIYCEWSREFPLTAEQQAEIEWYRGLANNFGQGGSNDVPPVPGGAVLGAYKGGPAEPVESGEKDEQDKTEDVSQDDSTEDGSGSEEVQETSPAEKSGGFWNFLKNIF